MVARIDRMGELEHNPVLTPECVLRGLADSAASAASTYSQPAQHYPTPELGIQRSLLPRPTPSENPVTFLQLTSLLPGRAPDYGY